MKEVGVPIHLLEISHKSCSEPSMTRSSGGKDAIVCVVGRNSKITDHFLHIT